MHRLNHYELKAFFRLISKGRTWPQATEELGLSVSRVKRTLNDIEIRSFVVDLSMVAGAEKEMLDGYAIRTIDRA